MCVQGEGLIYVCDKGGVDMCDKGGVDIMCVIRECDRGGVDICVCKGRGWPAGTRYRIAGYFRGMYISRIATSILVQEN